MTTQEEEPELKDLITQGLESKGILGNIKVPRIYQEYFLIFIFISLFKHAQSIYFNYLLIYTCFLN